MFSLERSFEKSGFNWRRSDLQLSQLTEFDKKGASLQKADPYLMFTNGLVVP